MNDGIKWIIGVQNAYQVAVRVVEVSNTFDKTVQRIFPFAPDFFLGSRLVSNPYGKLGFFFEHDINTTMETVVDGYHQNTHGRLLYLSDDHEQYMIIYEPQIGVDALFIRRI